MTRPKADADGWLTDPISRDRVIANVVVKGIREIITLLRAMRDEQAVTRALEQENRELRGEIQDLWQAVHAQAGARLPTHKPLWEACPWSGCSLPSGHPGNHRGSLRAQS